MGQVWLGMSDELWEEVYQVVGRLMKTMNLPHWRIKLSREPDDEDTGASIHPIDGQWVATMKLGIYWHTMTVADKRNSLVHELIHVHLQPMNDVMRLGLPVILGQPIYNTLWEPFRQQNEYAVDAISRFITEMIEWDGAFEPKDEEEL